MALSTKQVGSAASSSVAAATARIGNGGRNVASTTRGDVEKLDFNPNLGVNGEQILRFQQESGNLNPDGKRGSRENRDGFTPLLNRGNLGIELDNTDDHNADGSPKLFLDQVLRGIGSYEENMRVTSPASVKPGSVMNYLF
ncbi:hypothetical protein CU669_14280 [Paramagnetospirillum kuznetsovii]|uniref:Uncharacterized protein n=1 Tax=Paramagnetospirillum kuznetsovii TaxID=2053833 RepID=A0A364NWA7_9PROT|nr:hypothetical protein [Paramagnetospirillum kuznetsovii]RAU21333.1 hypothetical protein CU669_14280 [Paramagnetospirillum kuznetsovii]